MIGELWKRVSKVGFLEQQAAERARQIERLEAEVAAVHATARVLGEDETKLTEAEVMEALASLTENDPVWLALMALFDHEIREAGEMTTTPGVFDQDGWEGRLAHAAGGCEWLKRFKEKIEDLRVRARAEKE